MPKQISRRDFIKLAGMLPLSLMAPQNVSLLNDQQNVIIIVFDALSAYHLPFLGYHRETMPNLSRLAQRAIIYHNHYAGGNFTTPGTASLLTGTQPWTHRAFQISKLVEKSFHKKNIFTAFQDYYRIAYSHNTLVNALEKQFKDSIDNLVPKERLLLKNNFSPTFIEKDEDIFNVSWVRSFDTRADGSAYSLFLSHLNELQNKLIDIKYARINTQFPLGIPGNYIDFMLEDATDWFKVNLGKFPQPFIGYFHFLPPHAPYRTHRDFYGLFMGDGKKQKQKPLDRFSQINDFEQVNEYRMMYDEFILYADREFGKFFDHLNKSVLSENTWVVLTTDHGEMFERGILGHRTPVLYEPIIRIPLIIFEPGRTDQLEIHTATSAIDILPTLLHVTDHQPANWVEGKILPPFSNKQIDDKSSVYVLEAKKNQLDAPLTVATVALIKNGYKLMYFFGYEELGTAGERIELYDLKADPEEMNDLSSTKNETATELLNEVKAKLAEVNAPYQ